MEPGVEREAAGPGGPGRCGIGRTASPADRRPSYGDSTGAGKLRRPGAGLGQRAPEAAVSQPGRRKGAGRGSERPPPWSRNRLRPRCRPSWWPQRPFLNGKVSRDRRSDPAKGARRPATAPESTPAKSPVSGGTAKAHQHQHRCRDQDRLWNPITTLGPSRGGAAIRPGKLSTVNARSSSSGKKPKIHFGNSPRAQSQIPR